MTFPSLRRGCCAPCYQRVPAVVTGSHFNHVTAHTIVEPKVSRFVGFCAAHDRLPAPQQRSLRHLGDGPLGCQLGQAVRLRRHGRSTRRHQLLTELTGSNVYLE